MGSNSISNNSNNIRVNSNYTNKKYGSTIGKSGGSSQAALASRARTAKTEEFDLSSPTVIAQKENMVKKSEVTKQIETVISYLDNTKNTLEEQKEGLLNKSRSFAVSANRGQYPELYYEENTKGAKKYLNPAEAIKSDKYFKKYLKENGYPTDKERMSADKYSLLKQQYTNYINTVYTEKYNKCFSEALGMTYAEYREKLTQLNNDIESIKASKYELTQQAKEQPYIELMDTDDFQNYISNNKNNPNSELYKLYEIKNGTVSLNNDSYWRFEYFTEQDMLIFSYLWDTQSPKVAREYVEAIEDKLNKAEGQANAEKFLDSLRDENGNIDADVWAGVLSGAKGFENGLSTFFEGLGNVFSGEGMMSTSQYEQMYILSELTNSAGNYISKIVNEISEKQGQEAAADFASKIYNTDTGEINLEYAKSVLSVQEYNNLVIKINTDKKSILDNVYELSSSAGNMLPSMIVSLAVSAVATPAAGSVVGSTLMGISAGGNSKNQALVQGNDLLASTMYGVFSGVSETTLGLLLGNIPGLNQGASLSLKGLFKEGLEEMLQEYVDAGLRASILGETIDITQLNKDAVKSFIYGAVMSGIMNGGQVAFTAVTSVGLVKINNLSEAIAFAKENGVDIDSLPSEGVKTEIQQSSNNTASTQSAINESVQSSSINPRYSDIDGQIAMANNNTRKGNFASIYIDNVSSLTEEQISSIKNIDNVIFKLPDGVDMDIAALLNKRNSAKMDSVLSNALNEISSTASNDTIQNNMNKQRTSQSIIDDNILITSKIAKYDAIVKFARQELGKVSSKFAQLYEEGKFTGKLIRNFLGYEEHNFVHVQRVAAESLQIANVINQNIFSLEGCREIDLDIVYKAGLAHDLGMRKGGYILFDDGSLVKIDDVVANYELFKDKTYQGGKKKISDFTLEELEGMLIRSQHPLNSAITVLQNRASLGQNADMIAILALVHSKSTSGVKNLMSESQLSNMIKKLYDIQGNAGYYFDASKILEFDSSGNPLQNAGNYVIKQDVLEQIRTGAIALRLGDAHALKTGFNHGGETITIEAINDLAKFCYEGRRFTVDELCEQEAKNASVKVGEESLINDKKLEVSKRIILGERNATVTSTKMVDGIMTYTYEIKSNSVPACTWLYGIKEKIGEYETFDTYGQRVIIELPSDMPDIIKSFYRNQAKGAEENWLHIEIKEI